MPSCENGFEADADAACGDCRGGGDVVVGCAGAGDGCVGVALGVGEVLALLL